MDQRSPISLTGSGKGFWLFAAWAGVCVCVYFWKIPPHPFLCIKYLSLSFQYSQWNWAQVFRVWEGHFLWALTFGGTLMVFMGTGNALLRQFNLVSFFPLEKWAWSLALGLFFWGILAEGLAFEKLFYLDLMRCLVLLAGVLFLIADRKEALLRCWPFTEKSQIPSAWKWPIGLTAFLSLCNLLAPEMSWDAISYQLALPNFYFAGHGFYPVVGMVPAHYPSLGQMFFSWGLLWGNDSLARSFCFLAHAGTAFALVGIGRRMGIPQCGWAASVFYWVFPIFNIFSTRGYVDLFTGFYAVLGLGYLLVFVLSDDDAGPGPSGKPLLGFLGVFALSVLWGVKYTAASFGAAGLLILYLRRGNWERDRSLWVFSLLGPLLFFFPWMLKDWEFIHDPVFPYLADFFHAFGWSARDHALWTAKFPTEGLGGLLKLPLIPWKFFFENYSGAPNEEVSLAFLVFFPLLFLGRLGRTGRRTYLAALSLPMVFWLATSQQLRLVSGIVALTALPLAVGYQNALDHWPRYRRGLSGLSLLLLWVCTFYLFQGLIQQPNPFANFMGFQSKENFLNGVLAPKGYLGVMRHLGGELPTGSKVLILGQQNAYYLERVSAYDFDSTFPVLKKWTEKADSPEGIYRQFRKNGFTHILYNAGAMMGSAVRVDQLGLDRYPWTPKELKDYEQFFLSFTRKVPLPVEGYSLYEVAPRSGFSQLPENLPGTEAYYLRNMREILGLRRIQDMIGKNVPQGVYLEAYGKVLEQHPEIGYPCFQWAFAELALHPASVEGVLKRAGEGYRRSGDKATLMTLSGDIFLTKNMPRKAIPLLEEAKKLSPERDDVARNLAAAYYNEHLLEKAAQEAERAAVLAPFSQEYRDLARQLRSAVPTDPNGK